MSDLAHDANTSPLAASRHDAQACGTGSADARTAPSASLATVGGAVVLLLAAWCAAGSLGLMAHPLRLALAYLALIVAAALVWPSHRAGRWWLLGVLGLVAGSAATAVPDLNALLVVLATAAWLTAVNGGPRRALLQTCTLAILGLVLYRLADSSMPAVWLLSDFVGNALGRAVGGALGVPLDIGATFAGLDFLVLMSALCAACVLATDGPRFRRGLTAGAAILAVHGMYLAVVAYALDLQALLPAVDAPVFDHPYTPPPWRWADAVRQVLPWNLPVLAAALQLAVVAVMFRWSRWPATEEARSASQAEPGAPPLRHGRLIAVGACLGAALLPVCGTLSLTRADLSGRRFLANQVGGWNWERPQFDRYGQAAASGFGMLPQLIGSLGGTLKTSAEFTAAELAQADVALLLQPIAPLSEAVRQRLRDFVHTGGSLLVVAGPDQHQGAAPSGFDAVLANTAIRVRRDVAVSEAGGWQHGIQLLAHPVTTAIGPRNAAFFTDSGSSLRIHWPARPLISGRWGWSDPGADALLTGVWRLESGERLGDLVLAAEQPLGAGRVVVLGDPFPLTNEGGVRGYEYTGRLLSYLAHGSTGPQAGWRQAVTVLLALGLFAAAVRRPQATRVLALTLVGAVSLAACGAVSRHATRVVPDGRLDKPGAPISSGRLAYIDASHVSPYSDANWAFDGINGLALTLMRSGYLTLTLPELTRERLERASVLVTIAPARRYTAQERRELCGFVERGGTLFCLVGAEEAAASDSWLAGFGLRVAPSPVPTTGRWREPEPLGHARAEYTAGRPDAPNAGRPVVQFYAAWPVSAPDDAEVLVRAGGGQSVVVCRPIGRGRVVLIGDTAFALNRNLEYVGGEPFAGRYDNAQFWRWLISRVTGRLEWIPPPPPPPADPATNVEVQP